MINVDYDYVLSDVATPPDEPNFAWLWLGGGYRGQMANILHGRVEYGPGGWSITDYRMGGWSTDRWVEYGRWVEYDHCLPLLSFYLHTNIYLS